jgi:hypothetical protein
MKKFLFIGLLLLSFGCKTNISQNGDALIVIDITDDSVDRDSPPIGRYKISFKDQCDFILYTDTLYHIGDTLYLYKIKHYKQLPKYLKQ